MIDLDLLKPVDAGKHLGISENGVYRLIASGDLRAVDVAQPGAQRSKTRIRSDDLAEFIESRTRGSPRRNGETGRSRQADNRSRRPQSTQLGRKNQQGARNGIFAQEGEPHLQG